MQQTKTSSVIATHSISNVSVLITMERVSKLKETTHLQIVVVRVLVKNRIIFSTTKD